MNRIHGFEIYSQLCEKFWCITDTGNVSVTWCISFAKMVIWVEHNDTFDTEGGKETLQNLSDHFKLSDFG